MSTSKTAPDVSGRVRPINQRQMRLIINSLIEGILRLDMTKKEEVRFVLSELKQHPKGPCPRHVLSSVVGGLCLWCYEDDVVAAIGGCLVVLDRHADEIARLSATKDWPRNPEVDVFQAKATNPRTIHDHTLPVSKRR